MVHEDGQRMEGEGTAGERDWSLNEIDDAGDKARAARDEQGERSVEAGAKDVEKTEAEEIVQRKEARSEDVRDLKEILDEMSVDSSTVHKSARTQQDSDHGRDGAESHLNSDAATRSVRSRPDAATVRSRCMHMLSTRKWNHARPQTFKGYATRLRQFREEGLPAMRVISHETLRKLRRIPHSSERYQQDAVAAIERNGDDANGAPNAEIIFVSHQWLRPNWCPRRGQELEPGTRERGKAERRGYSIGDPDDAQGSKAKLLIEWGRWYRRRALSAATVAPRTRGEELNSGKKAALAQVKQEQAKEEAAGRQRRLYFWIDFACCDQDDPASDIAALPAYLAACSHLLVLQTPQYKDRAWCQVELLLGYALLESGYRPHVVQYGFEDRDQDQVERELLTVQDPSLCAVSHPADLPLIRELRDLAESASPYTCGRICIDSCTCRNGCLDWTVANVCCLGQLCGLVAWDEARTVRGGKTKLMLSGPSVGGVQAEVGTVDRMHP